MDIKNVRIDSRGLHGQVAVSWIPNLHIDRVVIVDDEIVRNDVQKKIIKMACPEGVKLSIIDINRFKERLDEKDAYPNQSVMVIFTRVQSLKYLSDYADKLKEINIANVSNKESSELITKTVYLTEEDKKILSDIQKLGVSFYYQMVVGSKKEGLEF